MINREFRMAFDRSIFIKKFTTETREHLQKLNEGLINLEKNPDDRELIQELFRSAHTVKGSSRMMNFKRTSQVMHKMEDLMGLVRESKLTLNENHYDLLFETLDVIKALVENIESSGEENVEIEKMVERLEKAVLGEPFAKDAPPADQKKEETAVAPEIKEEKAVAESAPQVIVEKPVVTEPKTPQPVQESETAVVEKQAAPTKTAKKADETIRVDMHSLDMTIKSVGELMVGRMRAKKRLERLNELKLETKTLLKMVTENRSNWESHEEAEIFETIYHDLIDLAKSLEDLHKRDRESNALQDKIIAELEENAFRMRMMPLDTIFATYPRLVRDLSKEMGKKIELVIHGEDTQLDKKMIEKLDGPLLHLLRNCADHGVEKPEDRINKGKPEKGNITLTAYNESGSVVIEISDDGNGLNIEAIRDKAIQKKLVDENEASKLSDRDIRNFIFMPGFSTSQIITDISGRGVGLDVVKKNVEELRGIVSVDSEPGKGSRFSIILPLTLSALRVLLVKTYGITLALPVTSVRESLIVRSEEIINIVDRRAIRLRNQIITLVNLGDLLQIPRPSDYQETDEKFVVIGEVAKESVGFIIDDILDEIEIVQKPLPTFLQKIRNISGVTILGDNEIILILYMNDLIVAAYNLSSVGVPLKSTGVKEEARVMDILVVDDSLNTREVEKSILEAHGYRVDLAKDGMDALKKIEKKSYDLIVTDVEMPRMDGFTLTKNLRQNSEYKEIPIVIVTSRESDEDKRRGIEVGANAYIVKGSFDQNNLIDTVDSLIG